MGKFEDPPRKAAPPPPREHYQPPSEPKPRAPSKPKLSQEFWTSWETALPTLRSFSKKWRSMKAHIEIIISAVEGLK